MSGEYGRGVPESVQVAKDHHSRTSIERLLETGQKNFDRFDLKDSDLTELPLQGVSFRGADVRGLRLCREAGEAQAERTNIRETDWTDAVFADSGETIFRDVDATGAQFGFSESLAERRVRLSGMRVFGPEETGAYYGFDGRAGIFRETRWNQVDFGGTVDEAGNPTEGPLMEALFACADFSGAHFTGVDLTGIDWSDRVVIDEIVIEDPVSLRGLQIVESQVSALCAGIRLGNDAEEKAWKTEQAEKGDVRALETFFGVRVVRDAAEG